MEKLFLNLFHMSISASYLILAVLLVRFLLRRAPKSMRGFLWLFVGIRLVFPFSVESVFSLIPDTKVVDAYIIYEARQPADDAVIMTDMKQSVGQPAQHAHVSAAGFVRNKPQTVLTICTKIWIIGMTLMLVYMLFSYMRLKNRVKMSIPADIVVDCLNGTNDKNCSVKIYRSDTVESPFLFGILRPRIYIPSNISSDEIPYVIRHELIHKKRKDYLIKPMGFLILSVYWFNPCVWAAYIMLCKDIELICDEHVVRELGTEYKKVYSQALLNSAVKHRMVAACPIAFGEVSVKERVKNVLHYKKPAFWVLAAAVLACLIVPVCFMTQKKAETPEQTDMPQEEKILDKTDSVFIASDIAGKYEMFLPGKDEYLSLDEYNDLYEDAYLFTPNLSLGKDGKFSFGYDPASSYLSHGDYAFEQDCVKAVTEDGKYHYQFTCIGDGLLRFDADESSELHRTDISKSGTLMAPIENGSIFVRNSEGENTEEIPAAAKTKSISQWAEAFCDRDAKTILKLASEDVKNQFMEQEQLFLGGEGEDGIASFGWSSPWPWGDTYDGANYHIVSVTEHAAEILYYAWVSAPHVTVWRELLTYEMKDDTCIVTSETIQFMDSICTSEEFHAAYPDGITGTMMDYYSFNGAGEALNNNAKANKEMYEMLFEPESAAVYLLNMLSNQNKVETHVTKSDTEDNVCTVTFEFHLTGGSVDVQMIQPYGSDGIWIPYAGGSDISKTVE